MRSPNVAGRAVELYGLKLMIVKFIGNIWSDNTTFVAKVTFLCYKLLEQIQKQTWVTDLMDNFHSLGLKISSNFLFLF